MPVSSRSVLFTIFPTKARKIVEIIECDDDSTYAMCLVATDILCRLVEISKADLVSMASEISLFAVTNEVFGKCLRGLKCVPSSF